MGFGGTFCPFCAAYVCGVVVEDGQFFCCDPRPGTVPIDARSRLALEHKAMVAEINAVRIAAGREPLS